MFTEVMSESCFPKDSCRTGRFLELLSISGGQQKNYVFLKTHHLFIYAIKRKYKSTNIYYK